MEKAQKPKTYHSQTDERLINSPENWKWAEYKIEK
jgi:hypothetical protein